MTGYFGPMRVAKADAVVVAGAEAALVSTAQTEAVVSAVRALRPDLPVVPVTFRPRPIASVEGARVFFATTAPAVLLPTLMEHLEREHGCTVVGATTHLSDRASRPRISRLLSSPRPSRWETPGTCD